MLVFTVHSFLHVCDAHDHPPPSYTREARPSNTDHGNIVAAVALVALIERPL